MSKVTYKTRIKQTPGISINKMAESPPCLVKVGVLSGAGVHPGGQGNRKAGTATYAEIAYWLEYGTENVPEFRFMRRWIQENRSKYRELIKALVHKFLTGDMNWKKIRSHIGMVGQSDLQNFMENLTEPSNSESTQYRKGLRTGKPGTMIDDPLIDTGKLRQVISWSGGA